MQASRILIVGRKADPSVELLLEAWRDQGAVLLAPRDLASPGFRHEPDRPESDRAMVQGEPLDAASLLAVVPRLDGVVASDLTHLRVIDRAYAAAESTALLVSWLSTLGCPVINRPRAGALLGPGWSHGRWLREALAQGNAVEPARIEAVRGAQPAPRASGTSVVVVGEETFVEDAHPSLRQRALALARASGADLLEVRFGSASEGAPFAWANLLPALTRQIGGALQRLLAERGALPASKGGST